MEMIWVLVANKSKAKLFKMKGRAGELTLDHEWEHPASSQHEQELTRDLPGRSFDSVGDGRHAMSQEVDPKAHEAEVFAQELIAEMEKAATSGRFSRFYLIAAPKFLGMLRKKMGASLQAMVVDEVAKNLTAMDANEVREYLSGALNRIS